MGKKVVYILSSLFSSRFLYIMIPKKYVNNYVRITANRYNFNNDFMLRNIFEHSENFVLVTGAQFRALSKPINLISHRVSILKVYNLANSRTRTISTLCPNGSNY